MQLRKVKDVARLLNTSERTILYKIGRKEIPAVRIGRLVRVDMEKLFDLMGMTDPYRITDLEKGHDEEFRFDNP